MKRAGLTSVLAGGLLLASCAAARPSLHLEGTLRIATVSGGTCAYLDVDVSAGEFYWLADLPAGDSVAEDALVTSDGTRFTPGTGLVVEGDGESDQTTACDASHGVKVVSVARQ